MKKEIDLQQYEKEAINHLFNTIYLDGNERCNFYCDTIEDTKEYILSKKIIENIIKNNFNLELFFLEKDMLLNYDVLLNYLVERAMNWLLREDFLINYESMNINKILIEKKHIILFVYYNDKELSIKAKIKLHVGE